MNTEQQRIAIAEACGWKIGYRDPEAWHPLPDFLHDLNAMHEAEKVLRIPSGNASDSTAADKMHKYAELLGYAFDATASQRAEAFLRTIGKWEENQ